MEDILTPRTLNLDDDIVAPTSKLSIQPKHTKSAGKPFLIKEPTPDQQEIIGIIQKTLPKTEVDYLLHCLDLPSTNNLQTAAHRIASNISTVNVLKDLLNDYHLKVNSGEINVDKFKETKLKKVNQLIIPNMLKPDKPTATSTSTISSTVSTTDVSVSSTTQPPKEPLKPSDKPSGFNFGAMFVKPKSTSSSGTIKKNNGLSETIEKIIYNCNRKKCFKMLCTYLLYPWRFSVASIILI